MWFDFDPNWRQFLGTTFLLVLRHFEAALPADLIARLDRALRLAVEGETDRVTAGYSNIALMKAVLEVEAGERLGERSWVERGHALAEGIDERYSFIGGFDEFNSPTYYGVDLLGLGMWRTCPVSEPLRAMGALLERRLWGDVWDLYHPRLRNLCGPFSRAYGMDMNRYVAGLALWMWPRVGRAAAPLPDWERADRVDHGHDLLKGPAVALLTEGLGEPLDEELTEFRGARSVDRLLGGRRRITAWLGERTMVGGESGSHSFANLQFCPATLHWMRPDGGVGTIRLVHDGPVRAVATSGRLTIECDPHPFDGAKDPGLLVEPLVDPAGIAGDRWALPGLDLRVEAETDLVAAEPFGEALLVAYRGGPETVRISLIIEDSATS